MKDVQYHSLNADTIYLESYELLPEYVLEFLLVVKHKLLPHVNDNHNIQKSINKVLQ